MWWKGKWFFYVAYCNGYKIFNLLWKWKHICRLQQEIEEVLGDRTVVTSDDLDKLQYTEQVNEYFRVWMSKVIAIISLMINTWYLLC